MGNGESEAREQEVKPTLPQGEGKEHWCDVHKVMFFKRGKMQSYAHPVEGTKDWCHEHQQKALPAEQEVKPASPPAEAKAETKPEHVDRAALQREIAALTQAKGWAISQSLEWLKTNFNVAGTKFLSDTQLQEAINLLTAKAEDKGEVIK